MCAVPAGTNSPLYPFGRMPHEFSSLHYETVIADTVCHADSVDATNLGLSLSGNIFMFEIICFISSLTSSVTNPDLIVGMFFCE